MAVLLVACGLTAVVLVVLDVVWTAAAAGSGAGPLSGRLSALLWRLALVAGRGRDGPRHRFLTVAGIAVVVVVVLVWAGAAWAAWWLVFSAADGAVVDAATGSPAGLVERAQFAGANFLTLGSDELSAGSGAWQFAAIGVTATGVVFVTLAISYFVPVASALAERRQLGAYISSLGDSPEDLVCRMWTNGSFRGLEQHLVALTPMVHSLAERHLTYPVLQYFHSGRRERTSTALSLVVLDEAVTLLQVGVAADARPDPATRPAGPGHRVVPRHHPGRPGDRCHGAAPPGRPGCPAGGRGPHRRRRRLRRRPRAAPSAAVPAGRPAGGRGLAPGRVGTAAAAGAGRRRPRRLTSNGGGGRSAGARRGCLDCRHVRTRSRSQVAAERCKQCNRKVNKCGACKGSGRQPNSRATCASCNGTKYDCPEHGKYWR